MWLHEVLFMICNENPNHIQVFTDGYLAITKESALAAVVIPIQLEWSGRLFHSDVFNDGGTGCFTIGTPTFSELHKPGPVLILIDFRGALWQLKDKGHASSFVRDILSFCLEDPNWNLTIWWIRCHCGIVGN